MRDGQAIRTFKSRLTAVKQRTCFLYDRRAAVFARELSAALSDLKDAEIEPRRGVELVSDFYRSDEALFEKYDDSDGNLGQVFTMDAHDLFVNYASACNDKAWIADLALWLQQDNNYGISDSLIEAAT